MCERRDERESRSLYPHTHTSALRRGRETAPVLFYTRRSGWAAPASQMQWLELIAVAGQVVFNSLCVCTENRCAVTNGCRMTFLVSCRFGAGANRIERGNIIVPGGYVFVAHGRSDVVGVFCLTL